MRQNQESSNEDEPRGIYQNRLNAATSARIVIPLELNTEEIGPAPLARHHPAPGLMVFYGFSSPCPVVGVQLQANKSTIIMQLQGTGLLRDALT